MRKSTFIEVDDIPGIKNSMIHKKYKNSGIKKNRSTLEKVIPEKPSTFVNLIKRKKTKLLENIFDTESEKSLAVTMRQYLATSWLGVGLDVISSITSLASCILYVVQSYNEDRVNILGTIELSFTIYFLYEYILRWFTSINRWAYLFEPHSIVDILTIAPTFIEFALPFDSASSDFLGYFRIIRIARVSRLMRIRRMVLYFNTDYHRALADFIIVLFSCLFIFSGLIMQIENIYRVDANLELLQFHDVIYFLVVTLTTVGYGDISPGGVAGRMIISVFVLWWAYYLPKTTNTLINLSNQLSIYELSRYHSSQYAEHVILCGDISFNIVKDYLEEFYHDDHIGYINTEMIREYHVIILANVVPSKRMEDLLGKPLYVDRVIYLRGSASNIDDLQRAEAHLASKIFVVANKYSSRADKMDEITTFRALSIKKYCMYMGDPKISLCVQLLERRGRYKYDRINSIDEHVASKDSVICIDDIRVSLLAKSTVCKGISTLISNLTKSVSEDDKHSLSSITSTKQYLDGMEYEIYFTSLSVSLSGMPFITVVKTVYDELNTLLIGLVDDNGVQLNIGSTKIPNLGEYNIQGIVIATDAKEADLSSFLIPSYMEENAQAELPREIVFENELFPTEPVKDKTKTKKVFNILAKNITDIQKAGVGISEGKSNHTTQVKPGFLISDSNTMTTSTTNKIFIALKDHIIVCGSRQNSVKYVDALRHHFNGVILIVLKPEKQDIVLPTDRNLYIVEGVIQNPNILKKISIDTAFQITILSNAVSNDDDGKFADFESVSSYLAIKKFAPNIAVLVELRTPDGLAEFEKVSTVQESHFDFYPEISSKFTSGEAFVSGISDRLLWQSFHNTELVNLIMCLLKNKSIVDNTICETFERVQIPTAFIGRKVKALFHHFLNEHNILVGLQRSWIAGSFVYCCPHPHVLVERHDVAFIIRESIQR